MPMSSLKPRALMIVRNSVTEDSRVLKSAWSLAEGGWDVLVLGASSDGGVDQFTVGAAVVARVPAKFTVRLTIIRRLGRKYRYLKGKYARKLFPVPNATPAVPGLSRAVGVMSPYALAFKPHVIHAHDYTALPIASALRERLRVAGTNSKLIYDAHEYLQGVHHLTPSAHIAFTNAEKEGAAKSDAVLVVSEEMGPLIRDYLSLPFAPIVVANDPVVEGRRDSLLDLRSACGLEPGVPLMVYSGAVAPQRGLGTVVEALPSMPGVHLAIIAQNSNPHVPPLVEAAHKTGVGDRVHVLSYVPNAELVSYLSTADVGLIPILHRPNHEISLITKFGEYAQANLPILVSDVRTMAAEVRRIGNGEVFIADDSVSFIEAANKVLGDLAKYRAAYTPEVLYSRSWARQAEVLLNVYANLVADTGLTAIADGAHDFVLGDVKPLSGPNEFAR
jgi:glycosyltransferase involved in cell wall biosynthesis